MMKKTYYLFIYIEREPERILATLIKKLPNKDDNSDKEMEDNKIDKENKENISDNEPPRASASNEATQASPAQEEEYSWTSNSDKH